MRFTISSLREMKSKHRKAILFVVDIVLMTVCYLVTWLILMGRIEMSEYTLTLLLSWIMFVVIFSVVFLLFGMYESLWRYAEAYEYSKCLLATFTAAALFGAVTLAVLREPLVPYRVPISVYFLSAMLAGMSTLMLRMFYRAVRTSRLGAKVRSGTKKVLIVGAGETGNAVLQDIAREPKRKYDVVCIVDDDPDKVGRSMQRVKVAGFTKDIPKLAERYAIDVIILAIPRLSNEDRSRITSLCAKTKCQLKKVPDLYALVTDSSSILESIRDVSVEDLLGRDVIDVYEKRSLILPGKTVLVTGAGGSIGSELCRQIISQEPSRLIMLDISENGLYNIQQEIIRKRGRDCPIVAEVASVRDEKKLEMIFARYKPAIVYHAAAHKHVPLMETAPEEAVKNNVFGTLNTARVAHRHGVERFVMVSTDKAVNPTNVMGATKRVCEMIIQCMDTISETHFVAVRFGNVLGSNGSVIPLFKEQIAAGGPVTITHPEMIRFFMTISEAVSLILIAAEMAGSGEIFVLDMGKPVKILDLAENLIRLSGYEPYTDMDIKFIGLRPGEKLYEELLMDEEGLQKTHNQKIFVGAPLDISPESLFGALETLKPLAESNDTKAVVDKLHQLVPGFQEKCPMEIPKRLVREQ